MKNPGFGLHCFPSKISVTFFCLICLFFGGIMLALAKDVSRVAPVRKQLRRVSNNSLVLGVNKACAGYLSVQSFGNSSKNYKLRETICCIRTLLLYAETAVLSEIGTQGFLRLLLSRLVLEAFVDRIAPLLTTLRTLTNRQNRMKVKGADHAPSDWMRQARLHGVYQSELNQI